MVFVRLIALSTIALLPSLVIAESLPEVPFGHGLEFKPGIDESEAVSPKPDDTFGNWESYRRDSPTTLDDKADRMGGGDEASWFTQPGPLTEDSAPDEFCIPGNCYYKIVPENKDPGTNPSDGNCWVEPCEPFNMSDFFGLSKPYTVHLCSEGVCIDYQGRTSQGGTDAPKDFCFGTNCKTSFDLEAQGGGDSTVPRLDIAGGLLPSERRGGPDRGVKRIGKRPRPDEERPLRERVSPLDSVVNTAAQHAKIILDVCEYDREDDHDVNACAAESCGTLLETKVVSALACQTIDALITAKP